MGIELKPCPFCGWSAQVGGGMNDSDGFYVVCASPRELGCFAAIGEGYDRDAMPDHCYMDEESAIAAWNRRTPPSTPEKAE